MSSDSGNLENIHHLKSLENQFIKFLWITILKIPTWEKDKPTTPTL